MLRNAALLATGIGIGLAIGWFAFRAPPAVAAAPIREPSGPSSRADAPVRGSATVPAPGAVRPPPLVPSSPRPAPSAPPTAEDAELRAKLEHTQAQLERVRADRLADIGAPIAAPPDLDPRFQSDALFKNVTAALRAAGFDEAQVTSVDCSEYPCIVYGEGLSGPGDFDRLAKAPGFAYSDDRLTSGAWGAGGSPGAPQQSHFALTPWPRSDTNSAEDVGKRLRYRYQQMAQTFAPPSK